MGGEQIRPVHNSKPALMQVIIGAVFDVLDFGALATALRIGRFGFVLLNRRACRLFSYLLRSANSRSVATGGMAMLSMIVFRRLVVAPMRFFVLEIHRKVGKLRQGSRVSEYCPPAEGDFSLLEVFVLEIHRKVGNLRQGSRGSEFCPPAEGDFSLLEVFVLEIHRKVGKLRR